MSGATSVRRKPAATGSRRFDGATIATRERSTHIPKRTKSSRAPIRAARATRASGAEDRPVLLLVVENPARASHDARERIFVDVNGQPGLLAQQEIEPPDERTAAGHDDAAIDDVARELRRRDLERAAYRVD